MKKLKQKIQLAIGIFALTSGITLHAQQPIIQTKQTSDPAPFVHNNRVYLLTGQDENDSTWFTMNNWLLYSSDDMVNWTDHGRIANYETFSWAKGDAWAAQIIEKNNKFYLYVNLTTRENGKPAVGVAVADSPLGPYYDAIGKPLAQTGNGDIDPTVFIDDDGQAYLYWGNPNCYYALLNDDLISLKSEIKHVPMTAETFGKRDGQPERPTLYEEGPWLYKKNKLYYLFWAGGPIPEHLGYSTSKSPLGPWKYGGTVMPTEGRSFTNHPGVIDFRDKTYLFYHNGALPGGNGFNRSVAVQEMSFKKDGSIDPVKMTNNITTPLQKLNPYQKVEAETLAWSENMESSYNRNVGVFLTAKNNDAYSVVKAVDFGKDGARRFTARVATKHYKDIALEVRLDSKNGHSLGKIKISNSGGSDRWHLLESEIPHTTGTHDLYFIYSGDAEKDILHFDYWMFSK